MSTDKTSNLQRFDSVLFTSRQSIVYNRSS